MPTHELPRIERRSLSAFVRRFPQVHMGLGLLGNALFVIGSVLFLTPYRDPAIYAFVAGSSGMFIGSMGEVIRSAGWRHLQSHNVDQWGSRHE
jgi:hypothetical protein